MSHSAVTARGVFLSSPRAGLVHLSSENCKYARPAGVHVPLKYLESPPSVHLFNSDVTSPVFLAVNSTVASPPQSASAKDLSSTPA